MLFMAKLNIYILYIMTGYSMVKNNQKINQLGHNQQTILNTTLNDNDRLNVAMVHSNPLNYVIRDKLALQFKERMLLYPNVNLIIVELVYAFILYYILISLDGFKKN